MHAHRHHTHVMYKDEGQAKSRRRKRLRRYTDHGAVTKTTRDLMDETPRVDTTYDDTDLSSYNADTSRTDAHCAIPGRG